MGYSEKFEIIVVDAHSTDNTQEIIADHPAKVKVLYDDGTSLTKARNMGLAESKGEIIFHLDADFILHPKVVENCLKYFNEGYDAVTFESGIVEGFGFWNKVQSWQSLIRQFYGKLLDPAAPSIHRTTYPRAFRRAILERVSGHDEDIVFYGEDADLSQRLLQIGAKIKYASNVIFYKVREKTLRDVWKKAYSYGYDTPELAKRHLRFSLTMLGVFAMWALPSIPVTMAIIGAFYSRSVKISLALFFCSMIQMAAQSLGIIHRILRDMFAALSR